MKLAKTNPSGSSTGEVCVKAAAWLPGTGYYVAVLCHDCTSRLGFFLHLHKPKGFFWLQLPMKLKQRGGYSGSFSLMQTAPATPPAATAEEVG